LQKQFVKSSNNSCLSISFSDEKERGETITPVILIKGIIMPNGFWHHKVLILLCIQKSKQIPLTDNTLT
jgi:hypothetical protein